MTLDRFKLVNDTNSGTAPREHAAACKLRAASRGLTSGQTDTRRAWGAMNSR